MKNYYAILEIDPNSGEDEIKKAYRALAMRYHPDRNPENSQAAEQFREITEAYAVLMDPVKRREYDEFQRYATTREGYGEPRFRYSQEDIFRDLFNNPALYTFLNELGKDFGKSGVRFGPSLFENLFFRQGGMFVFGAIFSAFSPMSKAYKFYKFFQMAQTAHSAYQSFKGAQKEHQGEVQEQPEKKEWIKKKIKGLFGNKEAVSRDGSLSFKLRVSPREAAQGVEKPLAYNIDGINEKLTVKIPAGTQNGTKLRLKGKGAKVPGREERSALYLNIEVG